MEVCTDCDIAFVHTMTNVLQIDSTLTDLLSLWLHSFYTIRLTTFLFTAHKHIIFVRFYYYSTYFFRLFISSLREWKCWRETWEAHHTQLNRMHSRFSIPLFSQVFFSVYFSIQFFILIDTLLQKRLLNFFHRIRWFGRSYSCINYFVELFLASHRQWMGSVAFFCFFEVSNLFRFRLKSHAYRVDPIIISPTDSSFVSITSFSSVRTPKYSLRYFELVPRKLYAQAHVDIQCDYALCYANSDNLKRQEENSLLWKKRNKNKRQCFWREYLLIMFDKPPKEYNFLEKKTLQNTFYALNGNGRSL